MTHFNNKKITLFYTSEDFSIDKSFTYFSHIHTHTRNYEIGLFTTILFIYWVPFIQVRTSVKIWTDHLLGHIYAQTFKFV